MSPKQKRTLFTREWFFEACFYFFLLHALGAAYAGINGDADRFLFIASGALLAGGVATLCRL